MIRNRLEIIANLLFWILTAWLIASNFSIQSHEINIVDEVETIKIVRDQGILWRLLACIAVSIVLFYLNLTNISQLNQDSSLGKIAIRSALMFLTALLTYSGLESAALFGSPLLLPKSISWGSITFYYTISLAYGIAKVWQRTEYQRQQLTIEKKEAELSLLRSQLHPHFLFNALNNLLAMVDQKENPALAQAFDKLSALLRYVVYDIADSKVPVQKEIDFIKNFADLHALSFEQAELDFKLEVLGKHHTQLVEPGIFVPFVENAFKYGVEPEKHSEIKITFDLTEATKIKFATRNFIHPLMQQQPGNGSGIKTAKERLQLVYPNQHRLQINQNEYFLLALELETHDRNNR